MRATDPKVLDAANCVWCNDRVLLILFLIANPLQKLFWKLRFEGPARIPGFNSPSLKDRQVLRCSNGAMRGAFVHEHVHREAQHAVQIFGKGAESLKTRILLFFVAVVPLLAPTSSWAGPCLNTPPIVAVCVTNISAGYNVPAGGGTPTINLFVQWTTIANAGSPPISFTQIRFSETQIYDTGAGNATTLEEITQENFRARLVAGSRLCALTCPV